MTKVGFVSLGCPKNLVDSEVMMGILSRGGYELTPRADEADVLVVNTCSFIEAAQKESVDAIWPSGSAGPGAAFPHRRSTAGWSKLWPATPSSSPWRPT